MIAKKSIETGEDCDSIPESMRQYLAMQYDPNKPGGRDLFGRTSGLGGYGSNGGHPNESGHSGKIGEYRRASIDCCGQTLDEIRIADLTLPSHPPLHLPFS